MMDSDTIDDNVMIMQTDILVWGNTNRTKQDTSAIAWFDKNSALTDILTVTVPTLTHLRTNTKQDRSRALRLEH